MFLKGYKNMITNKQLLESWNTYNISNIEAFKLDEIQYILFADEAGDIQSLFDEIGIDLDECQRRTKTAPVAGATVHHLADFGRSKSAPFFGM